MLLLAHDNLVRMSTAEMLSELGYAVIEATSAEEAFRLLEDGLAPDLLVTDHLMPGIDGTDLARSVRAERPQTNVLVISGYAENDGIDVDLPRLTKPFRKAGLAAKLAELGEGPNPKAAPTIRPRPAVMVGWIGCRGRHADAA